MFGSRKRKAGDPPPVSGASDRFHLLMLSGDAAALEITDLFPLSESDMERSALVVDDDGRGGMVVTSDDPGPLKARYISLGFKVGTVSIPRRRSNDNSQLVAMDLRMTGEYQEWRRDWLGG
jgi:hypothetical protein